MGHLMRIMRVAHRLLELKVKPVSLNSDSGLICCVHFRTDAVCKYMHHLFSRIYGLNNWVDQAFVAVSMEGQFWTGKKRTGNHPTISHKNSWQFTEEVKKSVEIHEPIYILVFVIRFIYLIGSEFVNFGPYFEFGEIHFIVCPGLL